MSIAHVLAKKKRFPTMRLSGQAREVYFFVSDSETSSEPTANVNSRVNGEYSSDFGSPLGISTRFAAIPSRTAKLPPSKSEPTYIDKSTGEILSTYDPTLKWQLQQVARLAFGSYLSRSRLRICCRYPRHDVSEIEVHGSPERAAYFAGVMVCGSVWQCPVCSAKIRNHRANELRHAIDTWRSAGGEVAMLTLTFRHTRFDELEILLKQFTGALRHSKSTRRWKQAMQRAGYLGGVRALEITHGESGWHPHSHELLFLEAGYNRDELAAALFPAWQASLNKQGLDALPEYGLNLQDGSMADAYVNKLEEVNWGLEHELTHAHSKLSRGRGGMTPFGMLASYLHEPDDGRLLALFAEYALNFKGRRQLFWSKGLRKRLGVLDDRTDEDIAGSLGEVDPLLASIPLHDWAIIRKHNLQGLLLQVVGEYGSQGLHNLLAHYKG